MNAAEITALATGIPAIIAAITALVTAWKGKANLQTFAQHTVSAFEAHNVFQHHNPPNPASTVLLGKTMEGRSQMSEPNPTPDAVDTDVPPPADALVNAPSVTQSVTPEVTPPVTPPPANPDAAFRLLGYSDDGGKTWKTLGEMPR